MLFHHATGQLSLDRPRILGILNVTPDSFSDGGVVRSVDDARRAIDRMVADGADIIDVGGESTRPQGAIPVSPQEEMARVMPVIEAAVRDHPTVPLSIDTVKSLVAREALECGASIVNDVSGFRLDPGMADACAKGRAGVVVMHSRGDVSDMATFVRAQYGGDVVGEVTAELLERVDAGMKAGIGRERIVVDPGIGFSKRAEHSLAVLGGLERIAATGFPVLVGVSRKRFIGDITRVATPAERVGGTVGANVAALERGARLFRVHDVKPNRDALDVAWAIMTSGV